MKLVTIALSFLTVKAVERWNICQLDDECEESGDKCCMV